MARCIRSVVRAGAIDPDVQARTVHVGLPITADLQTLPVTMQLDDSFGQGREEHQQTVVACIGRRAFWRSACGCTDRSQAAIRQNLWFAALRLGEKIPLVLSLKWGDSGNCSCARPIRCR